MADIMVIGLPKQFAHLVVCGSLHQDKIPLFYSVRNAVIGKVSTFLMLQTGNMDLTIIMG